MATDPPALPYRGTFGDPRPHALGALPLPPAPMPSHHGGRPLKAWRYVGIYGEELMMCVGAVRIGPARQAFWAVWDREHRLLRERTKIGRGTVLLEYGRARVLERDVQLDIRLEETAGIESICPSGAGYAWTRKQGGIRATGVVVIDGSPRTFNAGAVIDDTAAYYERHTSWRWSAGVGVSSDGHQLAWNLVAGVNDPPRGSERTIWIDGVPAEPPPCAFAADLSSVEQLKFEPEATRERHDNLLLIRSSYRQPFGTFSGALPGGPSLGAGYGVMEDHDVWW
jgi:Domain of unknown function (DUF2804), C-terminal